LEKNNENDANVTESVTEIPKTGPQADEKRIKLGFECVFDRETICENPLQIRLLRKAAVKDKPGVKKKELLTMAAPVDAADWDICDLCLRAKSIHLKAMAIRYKVVHGAQLAQIVGELGELNKAVGNFVDSWSRDNGHGPYLPELLENDKNETGERGP